MKRVYIIHRWAGGSNDDWRPWLKTELEGAGYQVVVPDMPDTEVPVIEKWVSTLSEIVGTPDSDTYFVGHSIGCQAILRYLETITTPIGGAVFVAGWFNLENLEDKETEEIAEPWTKTPINLEKVKAVLPESTLLISGNDPFGCFEENKKKFADIVTKTMVIAGAGHFTADDSYTQLPEAFSEIERLYIESLKRTFRNEGFAHVYEWIDEANTLYPEHSHKGKVSFYVVKGSITMSFTGEEKNIQAGQRLDVPVAMLHTAVVGPEGCAFVVGEEIEGDS